MQYRRLTTEELVPLEKDFALFLSTMQVTAEEWTEMKKSNFAAVEELLDIFSDLVFEKTLTAIKCIMLCSKNALHIFLFSQDHHAEMLSTLKNKPHIPGWSLEDATIQDIIAGIKKGELDLVTGKKSFEGENDENREKFKLIEQGGSPLEDASWFHHLKALCPS